MESKEHIAQALWYVAKGSTEIRREPLAARGREDILLRALFSGVSRGTERLVSAGRVPVSEFQRMRCPHQAGDFPFPVKYGYGLVGRIETGPSEIVGREAFVLHPHQDVALLAPGDIHLLPPGLPARRAVLAANMETALNIVWDSGMQAGQRVLVVGGGVVGLLVAALARDFSDTVTVVDILAERAEACHRLGVDFALASGAPADQEIVVHTSASEAGLALALDAAAFEGVVVEASWYGDLAPRVPLGKAFHARRLKLVSSQVGVVSQNRRATWSPARRLRKALELLCNRSFDDLLGADIPFPDAPVRLPSILKDDVSHRMPILRYP